jgi:hypothetical protein
VIDDVSAPVRAGQRRAEVVRQLGERVRVALFPDAAPGRVRWPLALIGYLVAGTVGAAIDIWWGGRSLHSLSRVWAEDGQNFLTGAYGQPFTHTFFMPYAGYMHAVPRVLAEVATWLPVHDASRFFTTASALIRVGVALFVFRATSGHLRSGAVRFALAAAVVVLPVGGLETLDNIANLHWFLTFAAFWALLWRPARWSDRVLSAIVVVAAVGSDPAAGLWVPLAVLRIAALRQWRDHVVTIAYLAAGVAQGLVVVNTSRGIHQTLSVGEVSHFYGARVLVGTLGGFKHTEWLMAHWHGWAIALGGLILLVLMLPALRNAGPRRWLVVVAIVAAAVDIGVALRDLRVAPNVHVDLVTSVPRYDVIPTLLMLSAVAAGLDGVLLRRAGRRVAVAVPRRQLVMVMAARVLVVAAFLSALPPDLGYAKHFWTSSVGGEPTWQQAVASRASACNDPSTGSIRVPSLPAGWFVTVPCSEIRHSP